MYQSSCIISCQVILVEEQQSYYLTYSLGYKEVRTFPESERLLRCHSSARHSLTLHQKFIDLRIVIPLVVKKASIKVSYFYKE